ncbi:MAG: UDP-N-acetylmuramoyl-L-alanyl-D-glutamate--2,6-diaminopimelate ligase [Bacteroidota bacterium]|nr:UDP-N-acetylmuramoyl-L-alanyl-D-glutamate--2,6-diaminopimelate ligase [Candidatus Kapabacteria bacterium]MDW8220424.1 UDP-N-acetylmuramoyl-L-alanyl-D-glutamate--2,6-diaminopimelate ligase [Bacteroidota bacterium]
MKSLRALLARIPSYTLYGDSHALARAVSSIHYDSRQCSEDALFVAIKGLQHDGHDFITDAIERGARVIVAERSCDVPPRVSLVLVPNARTALADIAHAWYNTPAHKLRIIGITGTNGKTTCTFIFKHILESLGEKVGLIGTTGNYIGHEMLPTQFTTPEAPELCALFAEMHKRGVTSVVMEVSSHALALSRVHAIPFTGAIFTNLTQDHLDFHGTMENYASAKKLLFDMLDAYACAVVNADDEYSDMMLRDTAASRRILFGRSERAHVRIIAEDFSITQTHLTIRMDGTDVPMTIPLIGRFNVENLAACVAMARALDIDTESIIRAAATAQGAPGRMQRIPLLDGEAVAIVDYAHTPDALEKALLACRDLRTAAALEGRIVCIFGCGGNRDTTKRPRMGRIAAELADYVILTSDNPRLEDPLAILDDILAGIPRDKFPATIVLPDRREAIRHALHCAQPGDILLIAGKGHETYQIIGTEKRHFDDVEEIRKAACTVS